MKGLIAGRYLALERIAQGTVAAVWRAFDRLTERTVALKLPHPEAGSRAERAILAEAAVMGRLHHPGIARLLGIGVRDDGPAPCAPLLALEHLDARPASDAPQAATPAGLRAVAVQALAALAHLHGSGLVHRDVKPANLLVGGAPREPRATLVDLGATVASGSGRGRYAGTPAWTAPEVLRGAPADPRADLYSLGLVLHRLAGGAPPYDESDPFGLSRWLLEPRPLPSLAVPPDSVARLVRALTRPDPAERPPSAGAALRLLGVEDPGSAVPARPPGRAPRARGSARAVRTALERAASDGWAVARRLLPDRPSRNAFLHGAALQALRAGFRPLRPEAVGGSPPTPGDVERAVELCGPPPSCVGCHRRLQRHPGRAADEPPLALLVDAGLRHGDGLLRAARRALAGRASSPAVVILAHGRRERRL